ncbi:MAG: hypothetical protein KDA78_17510 [Planctomycetaceae bacterium]|nr:hypothetical protein [Planctomycetaceae bacterium]
MKELSGHDERAVLSYLCLASRAERCSQIPGRDRFLVLALFHAMQMGAVEWAEKCRQAIAARSAHHIVAKSESAVTWFQSESRKPLILQLQRFCHYEHAEQLALNIQPDLFTIPADETEREMMDRQVQQYLAPMCED